ncbi:MAG: TRAM domain-containing protein [Capsulimonadaceae bacterium]|nr:TRAM domain-containing protein [Capsulimonadaceae bacterium]
MTEPVAPGTPGKPPDKSVHVLAQRVWRIIFVVGLVVVGAALGYQLGAFVVGLAVTPSAASSSSVVVRGYYELVSVPVVGWLNKIGFTVIGGLLAFLLGSAVFNKIVNVGESLKVMKPNEKLAIFTGLALGVLITAFLCQFTLRLTPAVGIPLTVFILCVMVYLCLVGMLSMKDEFRLIFPHGAMPGDAGGDYGDGQLEKIKIFDTNVIIDGRVADVCRTGFIEGPIYIPGFVLDEIQHIADSADSLKRARGRRGLDILNQMRSELPLIVRTLDATVDFTGIDEVDSKLVRMAKKLDGAIVTNDFNLNKVAELQGVPVLNINELANALKPVVLPGEEMRVTVIKEGKEQNQGVAYLDDGTMIVIEGGRRRIGETLEVLVSSVLQTVAGKMIFASIKPNDDGGPYDGDDGPYEPNPRAYTGGRTRRPIR